MSLSPSRNPAGQRRRVGVVELDPQRAAVVADGHRLVEPALADPQVVEQPQGLAGEVAELRVVPFALELGDDDDRQDDLVLLEPQHRPRVGQEHGGVEDVRLVLGLAGACRRACGDAGGGRSRLGRAGGVRRDLTGRTCHVPLPWRRASRAYSLPRCRAVTTRGWRRARPSVLSGCSIGGPPGNVRRVSAVGSTVRLGTDTDGD